MHYDEEFIKSLPDDYRAAILKIVERYRGLNSGLSQNSRQAYDLLKETSAFLSVYMDREGAGNRVPPLEGNLQVDSQNFSQFVHMLADGMRRKLSRESFESARQTYRAMLGTGFFYEFSKGDLRRIQQLVNEMRDLVAASEELEDDHKRRVLGRLEKLQSELHKKVSDLSHVWGELIEASCAARIIGENAKPIVDRMREIARIVWGVQARKFDLPTGTPFRLPGQTDDD